MSQYQRWYDLDVYLSCMTHSLEHMSKPSRDKFAGYLCALCNDAMGGGSGVHRLLGGVNATKTDGLKKFANNKRWYDKDQKMQAGFKKLYMLSPEEQALVAWQLFVPAQLVYKYELYCRREKQPAQPEVIQAMLDVSLHHGPEAALKNFGFYLDMMAKKAARTAARNVTRINQAPAAVIIRSTVPPPAFAAFA